MIEVHIINFIFSMFNLNDIESKKFTPFFPWWGQVATSINNGMWLIVHNTHRTDFSMSTSITEDSEINKETKCKTWVLFPCYALRSFYNPWIIPKWNFVHVYYLLLNCFIGTNGDFKLKIIIVNINPHLWLLSNS